MNPKHPYLIIRQKIAFWVVRIPCELKSTWQALENDKVFNNAVLYDVSGGLWQIRDAQYVKHPSWIQKLLMPWKMHPIKIELNDKIEVDKEEVINWLCEIIDTGSEFTDYIKISSDKLKGEFRTANEPIEIIKIAAESLET